MGILHAYSPSRITSALKSSTVPSTSGLPANPTYYKIDNVRKAENATLFFTRDPENNHVVMKILNNYKDIRYSLETAEKRQRCQLDALRWNKKFTKDVYLGLAQVADPKERKLICAGEILEDPTLEELEPGAEYALLMKELPRGRRLDTLLRRDNILSSKYYASVLARYMAAIHRIDDKDEKVVPGAGGRGKWGSVEQLREKLQHNFAFVDSPPTDDKAILQSVAFKALRDFNGVLKARLLPVFAEDKYQKYFDGRVNEGRIRRCHGDLKARNIWIMPYEAQRNEQPWERVKALDAVDFNPMYSTIDILSDFAMLVVDVDVRSNAEVANSMLEDYLHLTNQKSVLARFVLNYYIVEKAFIGAIVNILYDEKPDLGLAYLRVAERRLEDVKLGK
ncbi:MAG TPA: hypothetical protein VFA09_02265 [Ktedonobacteraceae bacterium]|nr:hypothetical protein [Ktedonobacteraceae bacterium]